MNTLSPIHPSTYAPGLAAEPARLLRARPPAINIPSPTSSLPALSQPSANGPQPLTYSLRRGLGFWELTFAGRNAIFKHQQGAFYVAYLLTNPPAQPIHALDLITRLDAPRRKLPGVAEILDPATARTVPLDSHSTFQQRNLSLDHAHAMRTVLRKQEELEAILEDPGQSEPVKEEVKRELIQLYAYEKQHGRRTRDTAQKAVHSVNTAIKRFHRHLAGALDATGRPHRVLRSFAEHLQKHLLIPSGRYSGAGRARAQTGVAGCFTYEPPRGITWLI